MIKNKSDEDYGGPERRQERNGKLRAEIEPNDDACGFWVTWGWDLACTYFFDIFETKKWRERL